MRQKIGHHTWFPFQIVLAGTLYIQNFLKGYLHVSIRLTKFYDMDFYDMDSNAKNRNNHFMEKI